MVKLDYKKNLPFFKAKIGKPEFQDMPVLHYLMVDGQGDPNTSEAYRNAIEALYSVAYTIKFMVKKGPWQLDYSVLPLEGLWWSDDMNDFLTGNKDKWKWTAMILQPECITPDMVEEARKQVASKKNLPALPLLRFSPFEEGRVAQVLYKGPYSAEGPTIAQLHEHIQSKGLQLTGKHHEIYLSDPRKSAPENLKTIIRQPVR